MDSVSEYKLGIDCSFLQSHSGLALKAEKGERRTVPHYQRFGSSVVIHFFFVCVWEQRIVFTNIKRVNGLDDYSNVERKKKPPLEDQRDGGLGKKHGVEILGVCLSVNSF